MKKPMRTNQVKISCDGGGCGKTLVLAQGALAGGWLSLQVFDNLDDGSVKNARLDLCPKCRLEAVPALDKYHQSYHVMQTDRQADV